MKKILPLLLVLIGIAAGAAGGVFLKPDASPQKADGEQMSEGEADILEQSEAPAIENKDEQSAENDGKGVPSVEGRAYVKIGKQTIVPVVEGGETRALMLFELAVDVPLELQDIAHELEPRLRDGFLRELMKMSHTGAFMSTFTDDQVIEELRSNLVHSARRILGKEAQDVLILDIMRQEF